MKFKLLIVFIFVCIMFTINKSHAQSLKNNDIQNLFAKIEVLHGKKNYYNVIELVNDNIEIIKKANQEWKEVINSYKYNSQYEIHNIAYNYYQKRDYIEAQKILAPIITEIKDSISLNVCNKDCCIPWSSCLWLYGKINQGLGNTNEALSLLNEYHEYVSKNLECFLTYEEGNYTKYAYVVFWSDLSSTYESVGKYNESIKVAKEILEYCKKNYHEYIFNSLMKVGCSYNALYTNEGLILANEYYLKALDCFTTNNNLKDYEEIFFLILSNFNQLGEYGKTIEAFNKYYSKCRYSIEYPISIKNIEVNNLKAIAYKNLNYSLEGSYEETKKIHEAILKYYEKYTMNKTEKYATQLRLLADSHRQKDAESAVLNYKRAFDIWNGLLNKSNSIEFFALLKNYLSFLQEIDFEQVEIGKLENSINKYISECSNIDVIFLLDYYRNQASYCIKQNKYVIAEKYNNKALELFRNHRNEMEFKEDYIDILCQKATILTMLGNFADADKYCNKALNIISHLKYRNLVKAEILETLALNYYNIGNETKSAELENEAISIRMECGALYNSKGELDLNMPIQLLRYSTPEEKISICSNVIKACKKEHRKYDLNLCYIYSKYASSLSEVKQYEKADSVFNSIEMELLKFREEFSENDYSQSLWNLYKERSVHEGRKGNLHLAAYYMEQTGDFFFQKNQILANYYAYLKQQEKYEEHIINALNSIRTEIQDYFLFLTEEEREIFMSDGRVNSLNHYGEYAYLMPNSKIGMQKIYDSALLYKGLLLNTIREFSHIISTSNNDSIKSIYTELQLTKRDELTEEIKRKEKILLNYIRENHSYSDLDLTWKDIQNSLKENECAVEFLKFKKNQWIWCNDSIDKNNHYIALIVTPQVDSPIYIDLFDESILEKAIACGSNLYRNNYGEELSSLIWGKINEIADNTSVIYFSPIGLLNLLNIESLKNDRNYIRLSSTRELCKRRTEDYQTAILYGGLVYDSNDYRKGESKRVIEDALWYNLNDTTTRGNYSYLPGTEAEVNKIAKLLDNANVKTTCFTGKYGTKDSFRNISGNSPSVLHIATHATWDNKIDDKDLKAGGLLFASVENMEDVSINERINFISAKEISTMDLSNTSLAVLSACQTGIGKITDDGVWGIQRAFKMAGVKTILMSLWKVDDIATALMMTTFYKELLATNNKHIAYKRAQQKVREKFENPYYWAGFIMLD